MELAVRSTFTWSSKGLFARLGDWLSRPRPPLIASRSVYDFVTMVGRAGSIVDGDPSLDGWAHQLAAASRLGLVAEGNGWSPFVTLSSRGERFLATADRAALPV